MIKIYGFANTRSFRITWMAEELGVNYDFVKVDFMKGENKSAEYLAVHPGGKIPAIEDNGLVLTESGAMINYLGDHYSSNTVVPAPGTRERALYDQWCFFAMTELEQPLWNIGKHKFVFPVERRIPAMLEVGAWEYQTALALLSDGLGDNDYILGDDFTGADILLAHTLGWGLAFKQPLEQQNLKDYFARCSSRPAYIKARDVEKDA